MPRTKKVKTNRKTEKLRAEAQEFHPTLVTGEQPLEFQDFPIPSDDYVEYFNDPYLASETGTGDEFERKPQRECDKLEGLDYSTFVVFSNVKNIPLEFNIAEPDDCPARLRLCTFGSACLNRECPYTHISSDEGNWDYQDGEAPSPREEMEVKVSPKFHSTTPPSNISFLSTPSSISSSIASSPLTDDSSNDSSDHSSLSPPDSPSRSSSDSSTESDTKRQEKLVEKLKSAKVVNFTVPKTPSTTAKPQMKKTGKPTNQNKVSKVTKSKKSRPMSIKTK